MTREEKCKLAIERGFTYNSKTGQIINKHKQIKSNVKGYINIQMRVAEKKFNLYAHQFAWYWVNKECVEQIDHINGIRDDNRICNLRSVTRQQNQWNRTTAKGYYKQIYKDSIYYIAQISINTKPIYLGSYNSEEEARNAYLAAKQIYHVI